MKTYYVIGEKYINSNTPEHGFGDFPERKPYIQLRVEADTKRKAQNKAKKLMVGLCLVEDLAIKY